jgi:hypothetical protein
VGRLGHPFAEAGFCFFSFCENAPTYYPSHASIRETRIGHDLSDLLGERKSCTNLGFQLALGLDLSFVLSTPTAPHSYVFQVAEL